MNRFTEIDLEHWPRREQFLYYRTFENQLFNITLEFHAGKLHRFAKARGESFFLRTLHAILRAVDATPQMRMRVLDDGRLVEYEHLAALSPILRPDREFTMALCEYAEHFSDFLPGAAGAVATAKQGNFDPAIRHRSDYLCASCLPSEAYALPGPSVIAASLTAGESNTFARPAHTPVSPVMARSSSVLILSQSSVFDSNTGRRF